MRIPPFAFAISKGDYFMSLEIWRIKSTEEMDWDIAGTPVG
jgi:hypothetical protein